MVYHHTTIYLANQKSLTKLTKPNAYNRDFTDFVDFTACERTITIYQYRRVALHRVRSIGSVKYFCIGSITL